MAAERAGTSREDEFTAYAAARWRTLKRSAVLLGCSVADAEDLTQTTLLQCYLKWHQVARAENRDAYVTRMLVNAHRASRRRRWWGERATEEMPEVSGPDDTAAVDGADAIERALGRLSVEHREVVVLCYFLQLSSREAAEALRVPAGTVKSRLSRALRQLAIDGGLVDSYGPPLPLPSPGRNHD